MKTIRLAVLLMFIGILNIVNAQELVNAAGGNATGSGTVDYSIGQTVYMTTVGNNGSVAQGVQQPFEISTVVGNVEHIKMILDVSVYPIPTAGYLTLEIANVIVMSNLSYQLYDANERLLEVKNIDCDKTIISMQYLVTGTYFVKIVQGNTQLNIFKIVKK